MKKVILFFGISVVLLSFTGCSNGRDNCIRYYIEEEGYSFDEAAELCDEAEIDPIRR